MFILQAPSRAWTWVAAPLAGLSYPDAEWVHVRRHRHLRFLERHGVLFEDNKGVRKSGHGARARV